MAARAGFETTTLQLKGFDSPNLPPRPVIIPSSVLSFLIMPSFFISSSFFHLFILPSSVRPFIFSFFLNVFILHQSFFHLYILLSSVCPSFICSSFLMCSSFICSSFCHLFILLSSVHLSSVQFSFICSSFIICSTIFHLFLHFSSVHPFFIHSFRLFQYRLFKLAATQRRSRHSMDTVLEFHAETPNATASEGIAQGPYVASRARIEPTTHQSKGFDSTNAPPRPVIIPSSVCPSFICSSFLHLFVMISSSIHSFRP